MSTRGKRTLAHVLMAWIVWAVPQMALAQDFDSGSNGSMGALVVTENTEIPLPPDGVLHYTTVTINSGATLTFTKNVANTPVYLVATGDVVIEGIISVNGDGRNGGPGGYDGGVMGDWELDLAGSPGFGPGGGDSYIDIAGPLAWKRYATHARCYGDNCAAYPTDAIYGNPTLLPLSGGSGGGGAENGWGGGGGGAILVASNSRIVLNGGVHATVQANAGAQTGSAGSGSGGSVRIVAPRIEGDGRLYATGGRTRIDTYDRQTLRDMVQASANENVGHLMVARLAAPLPTLTITAVGERAVADPGDGSTVTLLFPQNSDPNQTVAVSGAGFTGDVPIKVYLIPQSGARIVYEATLSGGTATVPVTFPVNVATDVSVVATQNPN